jgi:hypothetical protein
VYVYTITHFWPGAVWIGGVARCGVGDRHRTGGGQAISKDVIAVGGSSRCSEKARERAWGDVRVGCYPGVNAGAMIAARGRVVNDPGEQVERERGVLGSAGSGDPRTTEGPALKREHDTLPRECRG